MTKCPPQKGNFQRRAAPRTYLATMMKAAPGKEQRFPLAAYFDGRRSQPCGHDTRGRIHFCVGLSVFTATSKYDVDSCIGKSVRTVFWPCWRHQRGETTGKAPQTLSTCRNHGQINPRLRGRRFLRPRAPQFGHEAFESCICSRAPTHAMSMVDNLQSTIYNRQSQIQNHRRLR